MITTEQLLSYGYTHILWNGMNWYGKAPGSKPHIPIDGMFSLRCQWCRSEVVGTLSGGGYHDIPETPEFTSWSYCTFICGSIMASDGEYVLAMSGPTILCGIITSLEGDTI